MGTYKNTELEIGSRVNGKIVPFEKAARVAGEWLGACRGQVVFMTGAGISAESGIRTFRDPEMGLWKNKFQAELMGSRKGWRLTPQSAWDAYLKFREPVITALPNPAHIAVAECSQKLPHHPHVTVITQNVDMLHQMAGSPAEDVYDIHGTVYQHKCFENNHIAPGLGSWHATRDEHKKLPDKQPVCAECGSTIRPDMVLFDEELDEDIWHKCETICTTMKPGDVMVVVGTSGVMYPAAFLPYHARRCKGVNVIEVNLEPSEFTSYADCFVCGPASKCLQAIMEFASTSSPKTKTDH